MLTVQNLHVNAGQQKLLQGISFTVKAGASLALMGPSGSGKSLTAMAVAGLLAPNVSVMAVAGLLAPNVSVLQGHIHMQGQGAKGGVALIMQNPADCFDALFTLDWVFKESFTKHVDKASLCNFIHELLHKVGFSDPELILASYPFELSGGMLHRCMIALALGAVLCGRASCVVADEPLSGLDSPSRRHILKLLAALQKEYGFALLYIDHDLATAAEVATEVIIMAEGCIVEQGELCFVLKNPQHAVTKSMVQAYERMHLPPESSPLPQKVEAAQSLLDVQGIYKSYGQKKVLQDICFQVHKGQSLGLVGANGAGKSTLIRVLLGLEPADAGQAFCLGRPMVQSAGKAVWRKDIQMVFQHARLAVNPRMRGRDILLEPLRAHKDMYPPGSRAEQDAKVAELLAMVDLPPHFAQKYPSHMSGGQLQRLCLARALALQPKILLLDESLADLDAAVAEQLQNLLLRLKNELDVSFLYISHDMSAVLRLCDAIAVLHEGCIVDAFTSAEARNTQRHPAFKALLMQEE